MTATVGGLCADWVVEDYVTGIAKFANVDTSLLALTIPVASEIMFMLSGQQWPGSCGPEAFRPCCGHSFDRCSCSYNSVLDIGIYPITAVNSVKIDGQPFTAFALYDQRYIRRTDDQGWPACQDLRLASTEVNTFEVTVTYGYAPPMAGQFAAALLAGELALGVLEDNDCRLPRGLVSSVVREGVTVAFRNSETSLNHGYTGLQEIDMWLATIPEPLRSAGPSQVFVPEFHKKSTQRT